MAREKWTTIQLREKAEWEGGVIDLVLDYGIRPDDVEDPELARLFEEILEIESTLDQIDRIFEAAGEDEDDKG